MPPASQRPRPLVITGPTASGKSALALALAERQGGWIINADALQVYRDLRILSARPSAAEKALAPHRLFGTLDGSERCSVARWLGLARQAIAEAEAAGARPILCGGTGLYLKALEDGLAAVPAVPAAVLAAEHTRLEAEGWAAGLARLAAADPETAARLAPGDRQRLLRALAVLGATGRPLAEWQRESAAGGPGLGGLERGGLELDWVVLLPPRAVLREAVADRWRAMLAEGALEEVRALLARQLDPGLPAMKAVGVAELAAVLRGEAGLEAASGRAIDRTRQYLKRQTTWLRTQVLSGSRKVLLLEEKFSGDLRHSNFTKILRTGLTA